MPFDRPTLQQLANRIRQDMIARLGLAGPPLRRSIVEMLARVLAGAAHMQHGHLDFIQRQIFPDRSDGDYLVRQASLYGLAPTPATYATGIVTVSGNGSAELPAGALMRRGDGVEFTVDATSTPDSDDDVEVTAVLAGALANTDAGVPLTFESPVSGIDVFASVVSISGGTDQETPDALRARLLKRLRQPPQGGASTDYIQWSLEVPGVTRAWVYPGEGGAGTVHVRFTRDNDVSPIPDSGEVATVQAHLELKRPVTASVLVLAPVAKTWNFSLSITPDTTALRSAVAAELEDLFRTSGEPGVTLPLSSVRTAIGLALKPATGLPTYSLASPSADLTHSAGEMPVLGIITWT